MIALATGLLRAHERALGSISTLKDVPALLMRLTLAAVFISSGYGKIGNLEKVTEFFTELAIPWPYFSAVLVSLTELVGGTFVLVGLLTRVASVPLLITMTGAILTAQLTEIESITDVLSLSEFAYAVMFLTLALLGPGKLSIDHWLLAGLRRAPADARRLDNSNPQLSL